MKTNRKVKVGIVGLGKMGHLHLSKFNQIEDVQIVGAHDPFSADIDIWSKKYHFRNFKNLEELFFEADAIVIASPTPSHLPLIKKAIASGLHILCEKPLCERSEDAKELGQIATAHGLVLQVGLLERFRLRALLGSEKLQGPLQIESIRNTTTLGRDPSMNVILDLMVHDIDLVLSLVHSEVTQIKTVARKVKTETWDEAQVELTFASGDKATLSASRVATEPLRSMKIHSSEKDIKMCFNVNAIMDCGTRRQLDTFDALMEQAVHFIDCIQKNQQPIVTAENAYQGLLLYEKIITSVTGPNRAPVNEVTL